MGKPLPIFGSCSGKAASLVNVLEVSGQEERIDCGLIISSADIPSHLQCLNMGSGKKDCNAPTHSHSRYVVAPPVLLLLKVS